MKFIIIHVISGILKDISVKKSGSFDDFRISTQVFFSDTRHQKRSLAGLNEYFDNMAKVQWTFERASVKAGKRPCWKLKSIKASTFLIMRCPKINPKVSNATFLLLEFLNMFLPLIIIN